MWTLHLAWMAVVLVAATQVRRGIEAAGEWVAKAIMMNGETLVSFEREARLRKGDRS